jgi:serine protease SohB
MTVASFFAEYGLFIAELLTILVLLGLVALIVIVSARRGGVQAPGLSVTKMNEQFEHMRDSVNRIVLSKEAFKQERKRRKRESKARPEAGKRVFVVDFKGDLRASAATSLREEVNAILATAGSDDEVLVRLENAGGTVHEHGFAASQLTRLKRRGLAVTIAVDKVAASGGYLMACVADKIIAAPFAIVGSIGVLAQLPNFHRLLEANGIDFEQITAGRYKRTLTLFGENTDEGRQKLKSELEDVHALFKHQIAEHRPQVDIETVATGEHWYGLRALELKLVDDIKTSDDFLLERIATSAVFHVEYRRRKSLSEKLRGGTEALLESVSGDIGEGHSSVRR